VSRFLPADVLTHFDVSGPAVEEPPTQDALSGSASVDVFLAGLWSD
jgi:hypothetical protein